MTSKSSRKSRMLVISINSPDFEKKYYIVDLVVKKVNDVFANEHKYATGIEDGVLYIYFPTIYIDNSPVYQTIINNLAVIFKRNSLNIHESDILLAYNPPLVEFIPDLTHDCEGINESELEPETEIMLTPHTLFYIMDEFEYLMMFLERIHAENSSFFADNLIYISSAYYYNEKSKSQHKREDLSVCRDRWNQLTFKFNIDERVSNKYFDDAKNYAYTVITIEEILKRYSNTMDKDISEHREKRIMHNIRRLFNFNTFPYDPSDNELWKVFAEFIRKDHFYANGSIYMLDGNYCKKIIPTDMRRVINTFISFVNEIYLSLIAESKASGSSFDGEKIRGRYGKIIRQFENKTSSKFVADACENYNKTTLKTEIHKRAIAFEDTIVVYDNGKLFTRKAFMEDQFERVSNIAIKNFGKYDFEKTALLEVRNALKQIFVYDEQVDWFIKWCGSLFVHKPERCCLILYGPKGGNAKTTLANVLLTIFGYSAMQGRPDMLAPSGKSSSCTPFEVELDGKVLVIFSEPQKGIKYSSSALKEMTGGDRKKGAAKYKDPIEFEQTAKPLILCNEPPTFDEVDTALSDRIKIIKCIGRYVKGATPEDAVNHIYPRDDEFWKDATRIRAFGHLIVTEGFKRYIEEGLKANKYHEAEMLAWKRNICPFTKFLDYTHEYFEQHRWYTSAKQVYNQFMIKMRINMSYSDFVERFKETTEYSIKRINNEEYYPFYVENCNNRLERKE